MTQKRSLRILFTRARWVAPSPANAPVNSLTPANSMCEDAPNQGAADERRAEATAAGYEPDTVGFAAGRNLFRCFFDLPIWAVAVMGARPCTSGQAREDASGLFVITAARVAFGGANDGKIVG
jgi:hypothetical protein